MKKILTKKNYHLARIVFWSIMTIIVAIMIMKEKDFSPLYGGRNFFKQVTWLHIPWLVSLLEIVLTLFGSKLIPLGSQKFHKRAYIPTGHRNIQVNLKNNRIIWVILMWEIYLLIEWILLQYGIINGNIIFWGIVALNLLSLLLVSIWCLFGWIMGNRCCTNCRIFNWDALMINSSFIFIPGVYGYTLIALSILLFLQWEVAVYKHPERFSEETNKALTCKSCQERLCGRCLYNK